MVPCRGFEPRSPALQAGAFTRLAYKASWSGQPVTIRRLLLASRNSAIELWPRGGQGTDSNLRTPKGRRLRRRCFGLLHTCPCWLRRTESNGLSLGYEPSELPVLHSASIGVGLFISATARRYIGGRARTGGRPEVLIPNGCPSIPLRTGARRLPG